MTDRFRSRAGDPKYRSESYVDRRTGLVEEPEEQRRRRKIERSPQVVTVAPQAVGGPQGPQGPAGLQGPTGPAASVAGSNTYVQFNSAGALGADANLIWDNTNKSLGVDKASPQNARLYVGPGTGSLPDANRMGIATSVDTDASNTRDAAHANINVVNGSASGAANALVARADVNDASSTGDVVGLWGDAWGRAASARGLWGGNIYAAVASGVAYTGQLVGCEIAVSNDGTVDNPGGALHVLAHGASEVQFGLKIDGADQATQHALMLASGATDGPAVNLIYAGPVAAGNEPTGTSLFVVDKDGNTSVGGTFTVAGTATINGLLAARSASANPLFAIERYSADSTAANLHFRKSRGALGAHGAVQSGDGLGTFQFTGSDGSGFIQGAFIRAFVDGTPGTNDMPARLELATTPDGANFSTVRVVVGSDGGLSIQDGITAPAARSGYATLYVDTADGDLKVVFSDGTVKTIATDT